MERTIWLSYDLGLKGDYAGLYQWLDNRGAVECGNSIACLKLDVPEGEDVLETLTSEIKNNVEIKNGERFYAIYKKNATTVAGKFIIGNRKASPWEGYQERPAEEDI